jgi:hypothetical protein
MRGTRVQTRIKVMALWKLLETLHCALHAAVRNDGEQADDRKPHPHPSPLF